MFKRLSSPIDLEEEVLSFWDENQIFQRSLEASADKPSYVFYEGPPTANGTPHNGHVLTRVIKDVFPRYRTMRGYHVARKAGWDTHGLPVEVEVEKRLGIHGREAITDFGVEAFSRECVQSVFTYVKEWEQLTRQIGFWVNLDEAYVTYHRSYVESVWWALSELFKKGLLYQGHKVVWWWPQGGTTLSAGEVGMGYKTVDDPAVTVRFVDAEDPAISYLAWTTTPWTLPSNVALAVGEKIDYTYCELDDGTTVVLAAALAERYSLTPGKIVKGVALLGKRYLPLYDFGKPEGGDSFVIVAADHVTTSAGAGIVHTAPAFGEDDMKVAKERDLGLLQWIAPNGNFKEGTGFLEGIFCKDADKLIIRDLKERGLLFKRETVRHEYPFCWRADDDPLIQYARPAWFIKTTALNAEALANNDGVGWHPGHIQEGRFGDFLRNNVDWALSRERFWGTPLNIWRCHDCGTMQAPASAQEIERLNPGAFDASVDRDLQVHRPWIDGVTLPCTKCSSTMQRVPEVIDCWFDSGCMPFAQWGWPHQNHEAFAKNFPADFISEAVDQTRGWFYSLLMISTLLFDDKSCQQHGLQPVGMPRPYRNCVVLGHVCDMDGRKESKSKGNYTSPNLVLRGITKLNVVPDETLSPGTVGLQSDQVRSLALKPSERVTLSTDEKQSGSTIQAQVVKAKVKVKDTVHLHPTDLATLGLTVDGDVLWFQIPTEPPGADAFRWLFCAANAPWSNTRLSMRNIREGQREFLLRQRNVIQFFTIYANIAIENGDFDPAGEAPRKPSDRGVLDRWILHQLDATVRAATEEMDAFRLYEGCRHLSTFVDDLSNWYVRRSRSRFWGEGDELEDALWTLYEVLKTFARLIAPFVPFTAEGIYQALVVPVQPDAPASVHLCSWPEPIDAHQDSELADKMAIAREIVSLGLAARASAKIKVRQPLRVATVVLAEPERQEGLGHLEPLILDELNVHRLDFVEDAERFVEFEVKPDFKKLGRKLGKDMKVVASALAAMNGLEAKNALDNGGLQVEVGGRTLTLLAEDCQIRVSAREGYQASSSVDGVVAISTEIDPSLRAEGLVREMVNRVQNLRKELDLGYTDRIALCLDGQPEVISALEEFGSVLQQETLAKTMAVGELVADPTGWTVREWTVEGHEVTAQVRAIPAGA